ncbi:MAG: hypothetical protein RLZZ626_38 [Actinomycetota bacterium]|jgi:predicted CoA-binding protein
MSAESNWEGPSAKDRLRILQESQSIAIVGASNNKARASYFVASYLKTSSHYKVYFVNPMIDELLGDPVYKSLADLPEVPDIVDVFRKPSDTPAILEEAAKLGSKTFWLQLGISNDDLPPLADKLGIQLVMNRCIKIEHARFHGGLHLAGFDTGVISAKRAKAE